MKKIGYLGPRGSFTEEALLKVYTSNVTISPYQSISDVLKAVQDGKEDEAIVPIENSIEGSVNETLDILIFRVELLITKEIVLNVDHNLLAKRGTRLNEILAVYSHPHAIAQCRQFLKENLNNVEIRATNSTAEAAKIVAESDEAVASISTKIAAQFYRDTKEGFPLDILRSDIQDHKQNLTRFVIVNKAIGERTGYDKTSVVCFIHEDRPGSLLEILQEFASRNINLTKIESRPTKQTLGEYCFLVDMEGHIDDGKVLEAVNSLKGKLRDVKLLGSFPRWRNDA